MMFTETALKGVFLIEPEKRQDERGFFARTWCQREFEAQGLTITWVQCNISFNRKKGTLRGMHYQAAPYAEAKLVRCTQGGIYDVIVDLRPDSPTFKQWVAVELRTDNYRMLFIPEGFAHGFQTLEDDTEVFYQMSEFYTPEYARGVRWNDPAFGIQWPPAERIMSERDQTYADFLPHALSLSSPSSSASD
jgi:dTDP-4-dehydrorhamnose 3,5-epimerase